METRGVHLSNTKLEQSPILRNRLRSVLEFVMLNPGAGAQDIIEQISTPKLTVATSNLQAATLLTDVMMFDLDYANKGDQHEDSLQGIKRLGAFTKHHGWVKSVMGEERPDTTLMASYIARRLDIKPTYQNPIEKPIYLSEPSVRNLNLNPRELLAMHSLIFSKSFKNQLAMPQNHLLQQAFINISPERVGFSFDGKTVRLQPVLGELKEASEVLMKADGSIVKIIKQAIAKLVARSAMEFPFANAVQDGVVSHQEELLISLFSSPQTKQIIHNILGIEFAEEIYFDFAKQRMGKKIEEVESLYVANAATQDYKQLFPERNLIGIDHPESKKAVATRQKEAKILPHMSSGKQLLKESEHITLFNFAYELKQKIKGLIAVNGRVMTHKVKEIYSLTIKKSDASHAIQAGYIKKTNGERQLFSPQDILILLLLKRFGSNSFSVRQSAEVRKITADIFQSI